MKTIYLPALALLALSTPSLGHAQTVDYARLYAEGAAIGEAMADVKGRCAIAERRVPHYAATAVQSTLIIKRLGWTGLCTNGLLEGEGTLTLSISDTDSSRKVYVGETVTQGRMLHGRQVGPWLNVVARGPSFTDNTVKPQLHQGFYSWFDAHKPGMYQRNADGSFSLATIQTSPLAYVVAAGTVPVPAAYVTQYLQAASERMTRPTAQTPLPTLHLDPFDGLLPGGQVAFSLDAPLANTHSKRAALVFTRRSYQAFANMGAFERQLGAFATRQRDAGIRAQLQQIAQGPSPRAVVQTAATALRKNFAAVVPLPDLTGFAASGADCAVVVDVRFDPDATGLIKLYDKLIDRDEFPVTTDKTSFKVSFYVLNRQLQLQAVHANDFNLLNLIVIGSETEGHAQSTLESNLQTMRQAFPRAAFPSTIPVNYAAGIEYGFKRE